MNVAEENDAAIGDNVGMTTIQESVESAKAFEAVEQLLLPAPFVPGYTSANSRPIFSILVTMQWLRDMGTRFDYSQHSVDHHVNTLDAR